MTGTASENMSSNLPAQYLAYKQKSKEQKMVATEPAKIGNTNCWGSFKHLQMLGDPRTSINSVVTSGSTSTNPNNASSDHPNSPNTAEGRASSGLSSQCGQDKNPSLWSRVSRSHTTLPNSAELEKNSGSPKNIQMTNIERLKSMAASSVRQPFIPLMEDQANYKEPVVFQTQSAFPSLAPSLASSMSDESLSMDSSHYSTASSSRFWNMGKYFSRKESRMGHIDSDQDPSIGEMPDKNNTSYFTSSQVTKNEGTTKELDIEKLKRLRDQAAGLVPQSLPVTEQEESKEKELTFESQIDDMEHELYNTSTISDVKASPPHLRMDGFDDIHDGHVGELPSKTQSPNRIQNAMTKKPPSQTLTNGSAGAPVSLSGAV